MKAYMDTLEVARDRAREAHEMQNIKNSIEGKPAEPFVFVPPRPPVYHLLVARAEMVGLVSQALTRRVEWGKIVEKYGKR